MATDSTKLNYSSGWDIDQLIANDVVSVGSGTTSLHTILSGILLPEFEVQFQPTGSTFWYEMGTSSSDGTLANLFTLSSFMSNGSVFITTPVSGTARYFIWADKIEYS